MNRYIDKNSVLGLPYSRVDCSFLPIANCREDFIQSSAEYFVRMWMGSALPEMINVWKDWSKASDEQKENYQLYLDAALFENDYDSAGKKILVDDPSYKIGKTKPIGAFTETMMRWFCETTNTQQLLVEPPAPQPTGGGQIDFIEISGIINDYNSMSVKMWEVKGTDGDVNGPRSKIYHQLDDYHRRLYFIANSLSVGYSGNDPALQLFLSDMARLARNRSSKVHYGVFITYDSNVAQTGDFVAKIHEHPAGHPTDGKQCHHLAVLLIPDYKKLRLEVWKALHLS